MTEVPNVGVPTAVSAAAGFVIGAADASGIGIAVKISDRETRPLSARDHKLVPMRPQMMRLGALLEWRLDKERCMGTSEVALRVACVIVREDSRCAKGGRMGV
ncbi:hypothetical protein FACS189497_11330 [Betaproteobacteria bacterium]|nr:hypothetical protein FACS189497_11330 [Betaproteobacteria bacterium]